MERLGDDARELLERMGLAATGELGRITEAWPAAVGAEIARNAVPRRLARDGTLHVACASAVWAFELTHLSGLLAERLAEELGGPAPASLRFAPGPLPAPAAPPAPAASRDTAATAGSQEREYARALTRGLPEGGVKDALGRAIAAARAAGANRPAEAGAEMGNRPADRPF